MPPRPAAGPGGLIVYWRPGCTACIKLWRALDADERDRLAWVNVMADAEGSRYIRRFHDGDMVTPPWSPAWGGLSRRVSSRSGRGCGNGA